MEILSNGYASKGGYLTFDRYKAEPEILDKGDVIFKYFNTRISILSAVTGIGLVWTE